MVARFSQLTQLAPGIFLGAYGSLANLDLLNKNNVKVVVNCGSTSRFLQFLDIQQPVLSSDIIVLNFDTNILSTDKAFKDFHSRFNRILQNYLAFFYNYNDEVKYYINLNFENAKLTFESPTMNGMPLKLLFNVNRLLKLIRNVNTSVGVMFISENFGQQHHSNGLLYALAILYLMDNYNYNFESSYKYLLSILPQQYKEGCDIMYFSSPSTDLFNFTYYDDVLLIDSLKKFHAENSQIKQRENGVMTKNRKLKRSIECIENVTPQAIKKMA
ncbi:CIC11C00000002665 [Sungouiella intermedia]|uniref:CIC11C00000002665 n=1 Tax=Sungouiella intermedia TaxID=45354 RepID=A0A1L0GAE2_9ASCO|nr:CIC11C00000002665 [[Candida] intermedia]